MKRVFVCSPYRGDVPANVALAKAACREVLRAGDAPFAPHLFYPELLDDADAEERALGISAGLRWLAMSDEVLVVGPVSEGMRAEIVLAEALGIPVRYADPTQAPRAVARRSLTDWLRSLLPCAWADRTALVAVALVVLGFLVCPGCVGAACRGSCPAAEVGR